MQRKKKEKQQEKEQGKEVKPLSKPSWLAFLLHIGIDNFIKFCYNTGMRVNREKSKLVRASDRDFFMMRSNLDAMFDGIEIIGRKAFSGDVCLTGLRFPDCVKHIEGMAFLGCYNLQTIELPKKLKSIEDFLFYQCYRLNNVKIHNAVTKIGESAFEECYELTNINLPKNVTEIGKWAFAYCEKLQSINLPDGIKVINEGTFYRNRALNNIILPPALTEIGERVFEKCTSLENISIPDSCEKVGSGAFFYCVKLKEVKLSEAFNELPFCMFMGCESLQDITIPQNVKKIDGLAFANCKSLRNVTFKGDVSEISVNAFSNCTSLNYIDLPNSLKEIHARTFFNCINLQEINLKNVTELHSQAFHRCKSLKTVEIPNTVTKIGKMAFYECNLSHVTIPNSVIKIGERAFDLNENSNIEISLNPDVNIDENAFYIKDYNKLPKYLYYSSDASKVIISADKNPKYENSEYTRENFSAERFGNLLNTNYKNNSVKLNNLHKQGKIRFIPPAYLLKAFPYNQIEKFYINKNHTKWGMVVQKFKLDTLSGERKRNAILALFKVYYAMGGFSDKQEERQKAFDYITTYCDKFECPSEKIGEELIQRFSKFKIFEEPNKVFANFFMKYYKDNPNFMVFDIDHYKGDNYNYLTDAQKKFDDLLKDFPNMVINGNERRSKLTPLFVAQHCGEIIVYPNVDKGNESLAKLAGKYRYSQEQFDHIQKVYNQAKKQKNSYTIVADKQDSKNPISYRILEKDDILGFALGYITNCCQHIGGAAESCVDDGYLNKNSGFLVFEESVVDKQGNPTGEKRILAQAFVWYDPKTKTVCYDNIEVPKSIVAILSRKENQDKIINLDNMLSAIDESATNIMVAMNRNGNVVERVTTGKDYNSFELCLAEKYKLETNPKAKNRALKVYSDALREQFILKTYDELTNEQIAKIESMATNIQKNINTIKNELDNSVVRE